LEQDWNLPISQLGRIVRNEEGELSKIVEYKDATEEERAICEMNSGCYLFKLDFLAEMLSKVGTDNVQGEYYLPDLVEMAEKKEALLSNFSECVLGVNDRKEQALIHKILRQKKVGMLLEQGVEIMDPDRVDIDWDVRVGAGTRIWPGVSLLSGSKIGEDCEIENMVRVEASTIDQNVHLKQGTVIEDSKVEKFAQCGPYAHLRPGTRIGEEVKIGNFVETKKALFYKGAKASHLSYIGDAEVGERSNIGCGFITCNYDAYRKKNKTIIGKDVFMGSDCQTVAPVEIGDESVIASGSTITKDVPPKALSFARSKQVNKEGYADKYKKS
jgi:bifunctional UDP-N-acetylglucosamine pyrophosphorylase/glucosamine-1-phosphate N-acetyltransferase